TLHITLGAALLSCTAMTAQADNHAADLHFIMCGGEVREADQAVVDQFVADHEGVTVNLEAVP
ncbi:MAG: sugar ABC transporter substrate-binding protein, partial [Pseudoruegeria sp.]